MFVFVVKGLLLDTFILTIILLSMKKNDEILKFSSK